MKGIHYHEAPHIFSGKTAGTEPRKKAADEKGLFLKARILFFWVLPFVIILLAVKTFQTLLRIKLRELASSQVTGNPGHKPVIKPVTQISSRPDFVTPVPVSRTSDQTTVS